MTDGLLMPTAIFTFSRSNILALLLASIGFISNTNKYIYDYVARAPGKFDA